jgi:hypothetical protein
MSCNCGASIGHPLVPKCICKPKKVRELTDEEIDEVWVETCSDFKLIENGKTKGIINIYEVSRAILRKASEK